MAKNIVIEPKEPRNIKTKAAKMVKVVSNGGKVSRKNCHPHRIASKNDSIHSVASYIRNKMYIPLISNRESPDKRIVHYNMAEEEIVRYCNPVQREIQIEEMRTEINFKRKQRFLKNCQRFVENEFQKPSSQQDKNFLSHFNIETFSKR